MMLARPEDPKLDGSTKKLGMKKTEFVPVSWLLNCFHPSATESCPNLQDSPETEETKILLLYLN